MTCTPALLMYSAFKGYVTLSLLRSDNSVVSAQVHEREQAKKPIVIGIEIAIFKRHMLSVPECIDKLLAFSMAAHH